MRKSKDIKINHDKSKEFWDVQDLKYLLGFNCDYTVVSSVRNLGKSYAGMTLALDEIKQGHTILWERYNRDEFRLAVKTWENFYPEFGKPVNAGGYLEYTDENTGGKLLLCQCSVATNIKGYDDVLEKLPKYEIKDEFLPVRYLDNRRFIHEYNDAMEIRKTFKRNGRMRSIYLSNCLNWINPYTVAWEMYPIDSGYARHVIDTYTIKLSDGTKISESRSIIWESVKPTDTQIKRILRTEISSMNVNDIDDYLNNEFYKEYSKIEKCPDMSVQLEPIQLMSEGYYLGFRNYQGRLYFCKINPNSTYPTYVSEKQYIDIDNMHYRYPELGGQFEDYFNRGLCIFDNTKSYMAYQRWLINNRKRSN